MGASLCSDITYATTVVIYSISVDISVFPLKLSDKHRYLQYRRITSRQSIRGKCILNMEDKLLKAVRCT